MGSRPMQTIGLIVGRWLMVHATELQQLGRHLRRLADLPLTNSAELDAWYDEANKLRNVIVANVELSNAIPHFVWHYLSDADIRLKEPEYARRQDEVLFEFAKILERGQRPMDWA